MILSAEQYDQWLDPEADIDALSALLMPREWPDMTAWDVSNTVNRAGTDGPQLIERVDGTTPRLL